MKNERKLYIVVPIRFFPCVLGSILTGKKKPTRQPSLPPKEKNITELMDTKPIELDRKYCQKKKKIYTIYRKFFLLLFL